MKRLLVVVAAMAALTPGSADASSAALESVVNDLWRTEKERQRLEIVEQVSRETVDFESISAAVARGPAYSPDVKTGRREFVRKGADGRRYRYVVLIPSSYDPARRYPVRFYLHGGVARPAHARGGGWWRNYDRMQSEERISVFPASWESAMWWQAHQADNLVAILGALKGDYNIDENRVSVFGVSDGGTGAYYLAFRNPTPWASFLPFIGHSAVLANTSSRLRVEGQMHVANLVNRPFFVVNGMSDQLYPPASLIPYIKLFESAGVDLTFRLEPESGHDLRWWPAAVADIDAFVAQKTRNPLPKRLFWETEDVDQAGRLHWLLIEELGHVAGETLVAPLNTVEAFVPPPAFGIRPDPQSRDGVKVLESRRDGVARLAGIKKGDRIVAIEGLATSNVDQLGEVIRAKGGFGRSLDVDLLRNGQQTTVRVTFPSAPEAPPARRAFPREEASGRVELAAQGNHVVVVTQGVEKYRLLISPSLFDLSQPITVETNGVLSFSGVVSPDSGTLLKWAARDRDRTMLFGAEIPVEVGVPMSGSSLPSQTIE